MLPLPPPPEPVFAAAEEEAPPPNALLRLPPRRWPEGALSGAILPWSLESKSVGG